METYLTVQQAEHMCLLVVSAITHVGAKASVEWPDEGSRIKVEGFRGKDGKPITFYLVLQDQDGQP